MAETRTPKQIAADRLLRSFNRAAADAVEFAVYYDEPGIREASRIITGLRTRVRAHMHPRDREEQNDG